MFKLRSVRILILEKELQLFDMHKKRIDVCSNQVQCENSGNVIIELTEEGKNDTILAVKNKKSCYRINGDRE